ncbi:MAG TPA: histidine kinase dimerization/phospho-acceptor domain-containing protein, partial [Xanthomonadaceae bacterium]|nr:histidine kinase dimerization/phospho-acceptor domain-containing protein [Xanthomonadaceae bacterium]
MVRPDIDALGTPIAWASADGCLSGGNPAFARWLGVSARRLPGVPLAALEVDGDGLARGLAQAADALRLRRVALAFPGNEAPRFADLYLARGEDGGWLLEAHPVAEFPGEDPAVTLPSALSAALKGLAHELRNPLAGLKGAAQLLARRTEDPQSRELTGLIEAEV